MKGSHLKAKNNFRNSFAETTFYNKYAHGKQDTWINLARRLVDDICGTAGGTQRPILSQEECDYLVYCIANFKFLPGGRYLYYAGRKANFYNNCYLLKAEEDTREEWAEIANKATACLMTGGGIGVDYSVLRPEGYELTKTGGLSSGPIPLMYIVNEIGRNVMQGGSRRSAIYASLNWKHEDSEKFLKIKNWHEIKIPGTNLTLWDIKQMDFNFNAPLDMTNISLNYDNKFLSNYEEYGTLNPIFLENVRQALSTGEPGFSFNFGDKENETLRNACTEVSSEDDSDVCNLGSINYAAIEDGEELRDIVNVGSKFLVCGTIRADLPYEKVYEVREKNRRLGLGVMGIHEWLLKRGYKYEVVPELREWMEIYKSESESAANEHADRLYLSRPIAYRSIAPTGTIGIIAGTTTGIEPLFATAYKRRYLKKGKDWHYMYVIDSVAKQLIDELGISPENIESALGLAKEPERRIKFQADIQEYIDMCISSTINLTQWGSEYNNEDKVEEFGKILMKYAPKLRGFTCYPDGSRGGQPLTSVPYEEAMKAGEQEYKEHDICDISGKGGVCGS